MIRFGQSSSALAKLFASRCSIAVVPQSQHLHTDEGRLAAVKRALPAGYRPPTPYSLFMKQIFKPGMAIGEAGKLAGSKWKTLSADQIQVFQHQAAEIGTKRSQDFQKLSAAEQQKLYENASEARKKRRLRVHRAQLRQYHEATKRPAQPPNGYALYIKEQMQGKKGGDRNEVNRSVGEAAKKWKGMSADEKKQYNDEAAQLFSEYASRLEEWKTKKNLEAKKKYVTQTKPGRPRTSEVRNRRRRAASARLARGKPRRKAGRPAKRSKTLTLKAK